MRPKNGNDDGYDDVVDDDDDDEEDGSCTPRSPPGSGADRNDDNDNGISPHLQSRSQKLMTFCCLVTVWTLSSGLKNKSTPSLHLAGKWFWPAVVGRSE